MNRSLAMTGSDHARLVEHLLPGDGLEAAAILICAAGSHEGVPLVVREVLPVAHDQCGSRASDAITWPGETLARAQAIAEDEGSTIVLAHSHPDGPLAFSATDDASDKAVHRALLDGWTGPRPPCVGSLIMVPGGAMRARTCDAGGAVRDLDHVRVAGDDITHYDLGQSTLPPMAFGDGMRTSLARRRACVIGVSGTGSIVAEQLARLGFGGLTLIDHDHIERKNLNRILNSTLADARDGAPKVEMAARAISRFRDDIEIATVNDSILSRAGALAAARCDVVFSCVDSSEGRQIADLIARAFLIPLIDMGVSIPTRATPGGGRAVADAIGRIDYVQPGRSSLASRQVFTPASLRAEYLMRHAPEDHRAELDAGYIRGAPQEAPAVIALNMRAASAAVLEYIARAFPFRHGQNGDHARTIFRLSEGDEERFAEDDFEPDTAPGARGDAEPLLGMPKLAAPC